MAEDLDPCGEIDFADPHHRTDDGEQTDALVMFADCWDDEAAVERRKAELEALDAALDAEAARDVEAALSGSGDDV